MKQKKLCRIIIICCIFFIVTLALLFEVFGYIPIVGKILANNKIDNYVQVTYNKDLEQNIGFDFYNFDCYKNDRFRYSLKSNIIYDVTSNRLKIDNNKEVCDKIFSKYDSNLKIEDYNISEYINGSDFTKLYHRLTIYKVYHNQEVDNQKIARLILSILNDFDDKYNFTGLYINYYSLNGCYIITVPYSNKKSITYDMIIKNITKLDNDKLPQYYKNWINNIKN